MQAKKTLRRCLQALRKQVTESHQQACSAKICHQIRTLPNYATARHLALYRAKGKEIGLDELWHAAVAEGKICYFPKIYGQELVLLPADLTTRFMLNQVGILEPVVDLEHRMIQCDLICVPLVGFNRSGQRLGMGGGYYDRLLSQLGSCSSVGVGYSLQQSDVLPTEETDHPLDFIVTEHEIITTMRLAKMRRDH